MSSGDVKNGVPFITTEQMREVDRIMIEEYGILLLQMMENAGRNLAHLARTRFLAGNPRNKRVLVLAGRGGNGGGGLVCARRLHNWGVEVRVWTTSPASELSSVLASSGTAFASRRTPMLPMTPTSGRPFSLPTASRRASSTLASGIGSRP